MSAKPLRPAGWPRPAGYADGMSAAGRIVAVAGQVGWNPVSRAFPTGFLAQAEQALRNVVDVLSAGGARPEDVVRLTWYLTDATAYREAGAELGERYRALFGTHYPAMTVVVVAGLLEPAALVEIEATAVVAAEERPQ